MRSVVTVVVLMLSLLFAVCAVHAYVYYVEAENYDPDNSEPVVGDVTWETAEDTEAFNEHYVKAVGGFFERASTSLLYPIPEVDESAGQWKVWIRCIMPDLSSDSYFFYVSNDGGESWGPQQAVGGGGQWQDWKWQGWILNTHTPLVKGGDNVLKISERENSYADVICIRNDGVIPTDGEYEKWREEEHRKAMPVEPVHKITTTWGNIK